MYTAPITRRHKALFVLMIDRSGSMDEEVVFGGTTTTKAAAVALTANMLIDEMLNRSRREQGVSDYLDVAVVGYSGETVEPLIGNSFLHSISDLAVMPYRTERTVVRRTLPDGRESEAVIERKYWFDAAASGSTPLGKALATTKNIVNRWAKHHPASFPPIVFDLTDGEASDAEPEEIAQLSERIKSVSTLDGQTLLVNIHLSADYDRSTAPIKYPSANEPLPENRLT